MIYINFIKYLKDFFLKFLYLKKMFITINIIYLLCYISIFRADYNYYYDYLDIVPIPQILSIILMSLSSTILIYLFNYNKKSNIYIVLASLIIGLTPSYLQLFSHKCSSINYSFSIFISLFPILFYCEKSYVFILISLICNILSFSSCYYMVGIFPVVILFLIFYLYIIDKGNIFKLLISAFTSYFLSLFLYLIINFLFGFNKNLKIIIDFNKISICFKQIINNILFDYCLMWKLLILIIFIMFTINVIIKTKKNKIVTLVLIPTLFFFVSIFQFGIIPFLTYLDIGNIYPMYYYSYSLTLSIIAIICVTLDNRISIGKLAVLVLVWCLGMFSLSYGNLLYEQKKYDEFILNSLFSDLNEIDYIKNFGLKKLLIYGQSGHTPILEKKGMINKVLYKIVPPFSNEGYILAIQKRFGKNGEIPINNSNILFNKNYIDYEKNGGIDTNELDKIIVYKDTSFYLIEIDYVDLLRITMKYNYQWDNYDLMKK